MMILFLKNQNIMVETAVFSIGAKVLKPIFVAVI
jgi:hypothetical protein